MTDLRQSLGADEFDAFISYSRKDKAFAANLEVSLERFRPPSAMAVPQRHLRVFRDEGDMTGVEYYQTLDRTLGRTTKLIVVCSPGARASRYVDDEIRRFAGMRGALDVIPVLLDGLPNNEATPEQAARMAFPEALCELLKMPLAASFLGYSPGRDRVDGGVFEASWYTLLANLYGVSREEVEQRERRRRRNRRMVVTATVGTVMVALATLAGVAWLQKREADVQRAEAERQRDVLQARQLAFEGQALIDTGIGDMMSRGTLLAVEAMRRWPGAEATEALQRVLRVRRPLLWEAGGGGSGAGSVVAFSPDDARLAAVGDGEAPGRVLDAGTGKPVFALSPAPSRLVWDPRGRWIAGSDGQEVLLWSAASGELVAREPDRDVTALAIAPGGDRLATSADGRSIRIRRLPGAELLATLRRDLRAPYAQAASLSFHPDGDLLVSVISTGDPEDREGFSIDIWSVQAGRRVRTLAFEGHADSAAFNDDGSLLAVGVRGGVRLFDTDTWRERRRLGGDESRDMVGVNFGNAGRLVAAVGWDAPASIWRVSDGHEVARLEHERGAQGTGRVSAIALSPGGRYAATIGDDRLRVWQLETEAGDAKGQRRRAGFDRRLREFGDIAPPRPGERGSGLDGQGRTVLLFEGRQAHFKDPAGSAERAVTFPEPILRGVTSADGRFAALLGGSGAARVFEVASAQELEALRQVSGVRMAALSGAAGLAAFAGADGEVRVVSIADGHPVERFGAAGGAQWIAFSPGGKWLLASTDGIAFTLLRIASGQPAARVVHDRPATVLLFTADERHLATASEGDGTARIRDLEAGRDVLRWHLKTNLMGVDLAFADGDRIFEFTGTEYDETRLWRAEPWRPEDLVEAACRTVNRNLSEAEWRRYFPPYESLRATCARPP